MDNSSNNLYQVQLSRERQEARYHYGEAKAALLIPAAQALITGLALGLAAAILAGNSGDPRPWAWGLGVWAIVQACAWLYLLGRWLRLTALLEAALFYALEAQPDSPPTALQNGTRIEPVRIEVIENNGAQLRFADLPAKVEQLQALATGMLGGATFSEGTWAGRGRPFSRAEFQALRGAFIKRGLVEWINQNSPQQGLQMTATGRAVMRYFASLSDAPSLPDDLG